MSPLIKKKITKSPKYPLFRTAEKTSWSGRPWQSQGAGSIQPGVPPLGLPRARGARRLAPPGSNPFPPKSAAPKAHLPSVWVLVRAGGTWHSGGRKSGVAAPQLPTPGQRVSRQSPRWRCGATANGEPHAPRSARPAPPARPPASAQRSAASSASPSEPPWRRRLPGRPGLAWPLRLLQAAQPHPFPPTALGAARKF